MSKVQVDSNIIRLSRKALLILLLTLMSGFSLNAVAASIGCDDAYVQQDDTALVINVAPTGIDDTANIQCALDVAASEGYPVVRLAADTYSIGGLLIENFKGTLEGRTLATTVVEVLDGSIECDMMELDGLSSSVIKFISGEPRIRFMTINAGHPCVNDSRVRNVLHFTGQAATNENCDNDVIFGAADRIAVNATDWANGPLTAVSASAEGSTLTGCTDTLLGTFKLNRSKISNTLTAMYSAMKAGAQVDINFNEFRDNKTSILLKDTNQNTTITANKFFNEDKSAAPATANFRAIDVFTSSVEAPKVTRVVIHNNEFNVVSLFGEAGNAIWMINDIGSTAISTVITDNRFKLSGGFVRGIHAKSVSNAHVSANRFSGDGRLAVFTNGSSEFVTGWTITANLGLGTFTSAASGKDIFLGANTTQCIVGPGQEAEVLNAGIENTILAQE